MSGYAGVYLTECLCKCVCEGVSVYNCVTHPTPLSLYNNANYIRIYLSVIIIFSLSPSSKFLSIFNVLCLSFSLSPLPTSLFLFFSHSITHSFSLSQSPIFMSISLSHFVFQSYKSRELHNNHTYVCLFVRCAMCVCVRESLHGGVCGLCLHLLVRGF